MLTEDERSELLHAVATWAESAPDEPMLGFVSATLGGEPEASRLRTPRELVQEVEAHTDTGEAFLEMLEHGVRREGLERVVHRFYDASAEPESSTS